MMPAPAWVDGFNRAVTQALINADYTMNYGRRPLVRIEGEVLAHMKNCSIASVSRVNQEVDSVGGFDTFDSDRTYPKGFVEVTFTCACGHFRDKWLREEGTVTEVISMVANAAE